MFESDKLNQEMLDTEARIKAIDVRDEESLAEYLALYTTLIYTHKWIGSVYDIYSDNVTVLRENGKLLEGPHEVMKDTLRICAAFTDLKVHMRDCFAVRKSDTCYKVWRYFNLSGTNRGPSEYGEPTFKPLGTLVPCTITLMSESSPEAIFFFAHSPFKECPAMMKLPKTKGGHHNGQS